MLLVGRLGRLGRLGRGFGLLSGTAGLSEDQVALQKSALDFAKLELEPYAGEWDKKKHFPKETLRKAAALGFAGIYSDETYGGSGLGRIEGSLIFEALATGCPSTSAYLSIHNMCNWMISAYAQETQKKAWLPKVNTMEYFTSYCLTEPAHGSNAYGLETKALPIDNYYEVTGSKAFISGGGDSDLYVVMCRVPNKGITCLVIPKNSPGLSFGKNEEKMGWNCQPTAAVHMDKVKVPKENRLGAEGEGFKIAMKGLDGGRINIASCSLGGAWFALEKAVKYLSERKQFGKLLKEFQHLQFEMADGATKLQVARLMVRQAARLLDEQSPQATVQIAMAKRFATDTGSDIVDACLQMHGGYGYLSEYQLERVLRDLRVHRILEGTNEVMRLIIAKKLWE